MCVCMCVWTPCVYRDVYMSRCMYEGRKQHYEDMSFFPCLRGFSETDSGHQAYAAPLPAHPYHWPFFVINFFNVYVWYTHISVQVTTCRDKKK